MTKEELTKKNVSAISLGCDKNRVDLEHMLYALKQYGFQITANLEDAEIIIVNTCAFLQDAICEAIENIELALSMKKIGKAEKIIVSGCLPMREFKEISLEYPQIDAFITLKDNKNIASIVENLYCMPNTNFVANETGRIITNQSGYAFLKIAEGCSNGCAYCTIPRIRGRFKSEPMEKLLREAQSLVKSGYKELILVAQDTAKYGEDLYGATKLIDLLKNLAKIKDLEWIRLQYIYPEWVTEELLEYIITEPKMCKYLDMPLQHIDDEILMLMNRKTGEEKSRNIIKIIKEKYPEIKLRTTFIVGLPTEDKKKFKKLCDFVQESEIPYATFFTYSREEKTKAYYLKPQVHNWTKKRRLKKIVSIQNQIMNKLNTAEIDSVKEIMIDEYDCENKCFYAHSKDSAPEIDTKIQINFSKDIEIGKIYKVKITGLAPCGLKGEIL